MSLARLTAIAAIFFCTTVGWFVLGGSVSQRSGGKYGQMSHEVQQLWGGPHTQTAPRVGYAEESDVTQTVVEEVDGRDVTREVTRRQTTWHDLALETRGRKDDCVVVAIVQLGKSRIDVAAQRLDAQVRPQQL